MIWQPKRSSMNYPEPPSRLLVGIVGAAPKLSDPDERRRAEPRAEPTRIMLSMRRANRVTCLVRLHDASRYGLSIVCRERLLPREVIELRLLDGDDLHDRFRVVHITEHACEMRIGMIAEG